MAETADTGMGHSILQSLQTIANTLATHLPDVIGAALLLLVGWVIARLARALARRGLTAVESLLERRTGTAAREGARRSIQAFGTLIFWAILLFFVTAATQVLGLVTFTDWLARLLQYLPTLAAGLLIMAAGFLLARLVGQLVQSASRRLAAPQRNALARLAQGATLIAALLVGADQIGIRVTWLAISVVVVLGALLGGLMLAISLGARAYVANLIGAHYLRQAFSVGQTVRVAGYQGSILDMTATSLVLETPEGRVVLPGHVYHDQAIVLLSKASDG